MESLGNGSLHEFEEESLFTPEAEAQKAHSIQSAGECSFSGGSRASGDKVWRNIVCRSIKTVVFSTKLNLLMPFGPLAIFVSKLTGHNVSGNSPFFACCMVALLDYVCNTWIQHCRAGSLF